MGTNIAGGRNDRWSGYRLLCVRRGVGDGGGLGRYQSWRSVVHGAAGAGPVHGVGVDAAVASVALGAGGGRDGASGGVAGLSCPVAKAIKGAGVRIFPGVSAWHRRCVWRSFVALCDPKYYRREVTRATGRELRAAS